MLIPRKEKGQLEIYKCKLGIHDWVTEHWWEMCIRDRQDTYKVDGKGILERFLEICGNYFQEDITDVYKRQIFAYYKQHLRKV